MLPRLPTLPAVLQVGAPAGWRRRMSDNSTLIPAQLYDVETQHTFRPFLTRAVSAQPFLPQGLPIRPLPTTATIKGAPPPCPPQGALGHLGTVHLCTYALLRFCACARAAAACCLAVLLVPRMCTACPPPCPCSSAIMWGIRGQPMLATDSSTMPQQPHQREARQP